MLTIKSELQHSATPRANFARYALSAVVTRERNLIEREIIWATTIVFCHRAW